jgi:hypothetical protein
MPDPAYPPDGESLKRLRRSGWSCGEAAFTGSSGRAVWQVDGSNGENLIRATGPTQGAAWADAERQAIEVGMLDGVRV